MMLSEDLKFVPVASDLNLATGATQASASVNMAGYHAATFLIQLGTLGGADTNLTVTSGAAAAATTSALTFNYAYGQATALWANVGVDADVLDDWTSAAILLIPNATASNFMLVVEIEAAAMDMANNEEWLTLLFTDVGGSTGLVNIFAALQPRYKNNQSVTTLV